MICFRSNFECMNFFHQIFFRGPQEGATREGTTIGRSFQLRSKGLKDDNSCVHLKIITQKNVGTHLFLPSFFRIWLCDKTFLGPSFFYVSKKLRKSCPRLFTNVCLIKNRSKLHKRPIYDHFQHFFADCIRKFHKN